MGKKTIIQYFNNRPPSLVAVSHRRFFNRPTKTLLPEHIKVTRIENPNPLWKEDWDETENLESLFDGEK
jgi:hypothetical protein